ncbi:MAG: hypothetical protein HY725_07795 [Candidatus Rokubacteria bacterium]|nr:hypothetical protein [Candidatus Rokubacteria bacterium]
MRRGYALMRLLSIGGLWLLAAGSGELQAQQSDVRLDALVNELALMRRIMAQQDKRLSVLEQAIKDLREESRPTMPGGGPPSLTAWHFSPISCAMARAGQLGSSQVRNV